MTVYVLPRWAKTKMPSFDVTTRGSTYRELSPMLLGPVDLYAGLLSMNVENGWQYSKWYPGHTGDTYWKWALAGWASTRAERYPMGKGAVPLFSLWNGEQLSYLEARRSIYIPLYSTAVRQHYPDLLASLGDMAKHQDIALLDFDAYDHRSLGYSWADVLNDPTRKMGHGFVLAMMIEGVI